MAAASARGISRRNHLAAPPLFQQVRTPPTMVDTTGTPHAIASINATGVPR